MYIGQGGLNCEVVLLLMFRIHLHINLPYINFWDLKIVDIYVYYQCEQDSSAHPISRVCTYIMCSAYNTESVSYLLGVTTFYMKINCSCADTLSARRATRKRRIV